MLYLLIGESPIHRTPTLYLHATNGYHSYEVANGEASWDAAERQIRTAQQSGGKSTTVSVKSAKDASQTSKRKAGTALEEAQKEAAGSEGRQGKKGKKSR